MKRFVVLGCFFLCATLLKAQDIRGIVTGTTFAYQRISDAQHHFTFHTYFSLGYQGTCPSLINPTFTIVDNTLYVKGYYNVTGVWPAAFCDSFDTVPYTYQLPSNITHIITSTNVISYNNTPPYVPSIVTYENVYTQTFDLGALSTTPFTNTAKKLVVYPNPTNGTFSISGTIAYDSFVLYTTLGQVVKKIPKSAIGVYEIGDIPSGLYHVLFLDEKNRSVGESKLLKN